MANDQNERDTVQPKTLLPSLQPDAPSPLPQAGKGPSHRRRAFVIAGVLAVIIVVAVIGYYALLLHPPANK